MHANFTPRPGGVFSCLYQWDNLINTTLPTIQQMLGTPHLGAW